MNNRSVTTIIIGLIAFITLACSIDLGGIPININTAQSTPETEPELPAQEKDQPVVSGNPYLPAGALVDTGDQYGITLYNTAGQVITELQAPAEYGFSQGEAAMAGPVSGQIDTALVFLSWSGGNRALMVNRGGSMALLRESNDLYRLKCAPGEDAIVFVETTYDDAGLGNAVYIGTTTSLVGAHSPTYYEATADYFAFDPLGVRAGNGYPAGVFYAKAAYGIGGDIVFAPRKGFYYYEVSSNSVYQILDDTRNPVGFSPDGSFVAHTTINNQDLIATGIDSGQAFSLPVLPASNRGAGSLVFSPDNARVAWMEGQGWQMAEVPDFSSRIRIASYDGTLLWDIPDTQFNAVVGGQAQRVEPVGFLDAETLLVQVRRDEWSDTHLVRVNTSSGELSYFCSGVFLELYYP